MIDFFIKYQEQIEQLSAKYHVAELSAFGSVLNSNFTQNSDIDLLVKFDKKGLKPEEIGELYWILNDELELLFKRKVDLIVKKTFRNPIFQQDVDKTKQIIYVRKNKKYFVDIQIAINDIEEFLGEGREFKKYQSDKMLRNAIERKLITIGEAMNRILTLNPEITINHSRRVVQFRNKITHEYDAIQDENVWAIIINHLPNLKIEVLHLINSDQNTK